MKHGLIHFFIRLTTHEARAAAAAATQTGKSVWVCWTLYEDVSGRLRSGEDIIDAAFFQQDNHMFLCSVRLFKVMWERLLAAINASPAGQVIAAKSRSPCLKI